MALLGEVKLEPQLAFANLDSKGGTASADIHSENDKSNSLKMTGEAAAGAAEMKATPVASPPPRPPRSPRSETEMVPLLPPATPGIGAGVIKREGRSPSPAARANGTLKHQEMTRCVELETFLQPSCTKWFELKHIQNGEVQTYSSCHSIIGGQIEV